MPKKISQRQLSVAIAGKNGKKKKKHRKRQRRKKKRRRNGDIYIYANKII